MLWNTAILIFSLILILTLSQSSLSVWTWGAQSQIMCFKHQRIQKFTKGQHGEQTKLWKHTTITYCTSTQSLIHQQIEVLVVVKSLMKIIRSCVLQCLVHLTRIQREQLSLLPRSLDLPLARQTTINAGHKSPANVSSSGNFESLLCCI